MNRLTGKVAVVTGAGRGIGRAIAEALHEEGATTIATSRSSADPTFGPIAYAPLDVASEDDWHRVIGDVLDAHGHIDVLVNNAGIIAYDPLHELSMDDWQSVVATNQTGVWLGMREVIPHMIAQGGGSIINISSIWGSAAVGGAHAYHATKGAVRNMSKNAAITYATQNVRVTNRTARFLRPADGMERVFRDAAIGLAREHLFARQFVNTGRMAIANAGLAAVGSVMGEEIHAFERTIEVNLMGVWRTNRLVLPHVVARGGYILNIASLAAIAHAPLMAAYAASKAGARAFPLMIPLRPDTLGAAAGRTTLDGLARMNIPKLVLWADSDPIIPFKVGERFAQAIHAPAPETVAGAGHFLQEDQGEWIGNRIAEWLASPESVPEPFSDGDGDDEGLA